MKQGNHKYVAKAAALDGEFRARNSLFIISAYCLPLPHNLSLHSFHLSSQVSPDRTRRSSADLYKKSP